MRMTFDVDSTIACLSQHKSMETSPGREKSLPRATLRYGKDQLETDRVLGGAVVVRLLRADGGLALRDADVELEQRKPGRHVLASASPSSRGPRVCHTPRPCVQH